MNTLENHGLLRSLLTKATQFNMVNKKSLKKDFEMQGERDCQKQGNFLICNNYGLATV